MSGTRGSMLSKLILDRAWKSCQNSLPYFSMIKLLLLAMVKLNISFFISVTYNENYLERGGFHYVSFLQNVMWQE